MELSLRFVIRFSSFEDVMKCNVYIIHSKSYDKYYIGQTCDLNKRINSHNYGNVKSTKPYIPYELVWSCEKENRAEAMVLEKKLKNLKSKIRLKKFIEKYT